MRELELFRLDSLPAEVPFSSAVRVGDTVYVSGQIGHQPGEMRLVEGGLEAEAEVGFRPSCLAVVEEIVGLGKVCLRLRSRQWQPPHDAVAASASAMRDWRSSSGKDANPPTMVLVVLTTQHLYCDNGPQRRERFG